MQHVGQGAARTSMRRRRRSGEGDVGVVAGLEEELGVEGREVLLPRRLARTRRVQPVPASSAPHQPITLPSPTPLFPTPAASHLRS